MVFFRGRPQKNAKTTARQNGKNHKPENAWEHLVKGVCPYRAGRNACEVGPGCLPEAAGPKKNGKSTVKKR